MPEKYSIFHIQGGIGKHIAATAVAKTIKNNHPDRKLIVVCCYPDLFINLTYVDKVYVLGNTQYFYQTYVDEKDSILFHNEPYFTTNHIHKRTHLIQTWCDMYGLEYRGETPDLIFNKLQKEIARNHWVTDKPMMVIHTNGGLHGDETRTYSWARDMPFEVAQEIVERYKDQYRIFQVARPNSQRLDNVHVINQPVSNMELFSILLWSDKRVLIDSCLQHAAAALNLPSTVLWNATSPKVFGYELHSNIVTETPKNFKLPNSYLFDFDFMGTEEEYPYKNEENIFNLDEVFKSIEST